MLISEAVAIDILSATTFSQLRSLLQQMAQALDQAMVLTSEDLVPTTPSLTHLVSDQLAQEAKSSALQFTVVISTGFSALLQGEAIQTIPDGSPGKAWTTGQSHYRIQLTFEPEAIATFLTAFAPPVHSLWSQAVQRSQSLQPNDATLQSEFTRRLIQLLVRASNETTASEAALSAADSGFEGAAPKNDAVPVHPAFHQPLATALLEQIEQERLLNTLMTQVRQSLELPFILQTAVGQVRQFLQVDRLVIYQLEELSTSTFLEVDSSHPPTQQGFIAYESIASSHIPSVLNLTPDDCFCRAGGKRDLYQQGYTLAIADVAAHYAHLPCMLKFLQAAQVQAKLVAPIVVHNQLWGLIIAHQCDAPRHWKDSEQKFLQRIGEHLAIAITQAQLYAEIQQQKQTLEQRVIERTQELHDTMLAAQAANRAKSDFLAAVSHELRTPLTHVIGMSTTLLRLSSQEWGDAQQSLVEKSRQQRFLQIIHDSGEHLMELINDILDLSYLESGKAILTISEFSLSHLTQQCLKAVQDRAIAASVSLELDLQINPQQDRFAADPQRVRQILLNLLSNAIKFTPTGGAVTLRVFASKGAVTFQVKDTGIGIPEQARSLLFQKFQQLDSSYHRQYEGTGLGLALTKQLVELHGGSITVESTVGVGSVFTVHLPAHLSHISATPTSLKTRLIQPLGRVMLIENHEESAHVICDILNAAGYQLVWLLEGSMAMTQIEVLQPVVVLVSAHLSDMDGYNIIHQLRQNPSTKKIKAIALLEPDAIGDLERCRAAGVNTYLQKPIRPEQVLYQMANVINREE